MSKIVIIGIDGLDPFLLDRWKDTLPSFRDLIKVNTDIMIESTTPPDSICAWASIFTGDNPAEHGLIESIDYLAPKKLEKHKDRSADFRGRTFWDIVSDKGKEVCIINPFIAYPAWKVNGVMVSGPVFEGGKISAYPESIIKKYDFPSLGGMVDFPDKKELEGFLIRTKEVTEQLADVSLKMYKDLGPDLFFLTFLTLDRIKHFFWRYIDRDDIYYPGKNPFENSIKDFYKVLDNIIGNFIKSLDKDTALLVISDHGHRRRCVKSLNLNEILREKGYISTDVIGARGAMKKIIEKAKVFTLSMLSKCDLEDWIYKIARFIPNRKSLKKSTYMIDKENSPVTLSSLCGANPFGGINVKVEKYIEYEKLREKVINDLMDLNKSLGKNIIKWAKKREQVYTGTHEDRLPDILFELNEEYGVGMDFYTKPVTPSYTHKKVSGGHQKEAVLLVYSNNDNIKNIERPVSVIDLKNYILKIVDA